MKTLKTNFKNENSMSLFSNKVKLTVIASCVMLMTLTNCGGNDDAINALNCGDGTWLKTVQAEATAWLTATQAYGANPTIENCQMNKSTGQAYLNALEEAKSCVASTELADFQDSLDEARENVKEIVCE